MCEEVIEARALGARIRCRLAPPRVVERVPQLLVKRFNFGLLLFCAVKDVVAHKVHRQQRFALRVQRLKDHLRVVTFAKCDDHQLQTIQQRAQERLQARRRVLRRNTLVDMILGVFWLV